MARARSILVIVGALVVFPAAFAAAMTVRATIVRPLVRALPKLFSEDVRDASSPPTGEEAPSSICPLRNQVRIVPFYENGVPTGFRILAIEPGSIYRRLGIENGDVIRRINGQPLDGPERALELYSKLRDEKWIDVELERGGKPLVRVYRVD